MASRARVFHKKAVAHLTRAVKHLAWLHASPDYEPKNTGRDRQSRISLYKDSFVAELPDLGCYHYLFTILQRVGIADQGMNGAIPISMARIVEWCSGTGAYLYPTEKELLVSLSTAYVSHLRESEAQDAMPPAAVHEDGSTDDNYIARKVMIELGESL